MSPLWMLALAVIVGEFVAILYYRREASRRAVAAEIAYNLFRTGVPAAQARIAMRLIEDAEATLVKPRKSDLEATMAAGGAACLRGHGERILAELAEERAERGEVRA